jgi:hypothetical protein
VEGVREDRRGVSIGEVKELERNSFLVGCDAKGGEKHMDQSSVTRTFGQAIVLEGGERYGGI